MSLQTAYLYLRGLRQVDHTVFCVSEGQKTYRDPMTIARCLIPVGNKSSARFLDEMTSVLNETRAPITFNFTLTKKAGKTEFGNGEPWSPCDPSFLRPTDWRMDARRQRGSAGKTSQSPFNLGHAPAPSVTHWLGGGKCHL